jgi:hypothetical protein
MCLTCGYIFTCGIVQFDDTAGFCKLDAAGFLVDEATSFSVDATLLLLVLVFSFK